MNTKQLMTLKRQFDRARELKEFQDNLKKNPLQESEFKALVNEMNIDSTEKLKYFNNMRLLRKNEMIIDDIPESYEDFSNRNEADGKVPIKASVMKQMNKDEFHKLTSKQIAIYDDLNGAKELTHYTYKGRNGLEHKTGDGISVRHTPTANAELVKESIKAHNRAKETISKTLTEIEVNGSKYADFRNDDK